MFPDYTRTERLVDGAIHLIGVVAALLAAARLAVVALPAQDPRVVLSAAFYGAGLVAVFCSSAAYHLEVRPRWKEAIRRVDHAAIFLLIAGTYTPFALIAIAGRAGTLLLVCVWLVALSGMALKLLWPRRFERASVWLYLGLGWIGLPAVGALVAALPTRPLVLLAVGGILYSLGVAFHLWERLPLQNAFWHALVLAAAACHYAAVLPLLES